MKEPGLRCSSPSWRAKYRCEWFKGRAATLIGRFAAVASLGVACALPPPSSAAPTPPQVVEAIGPPVPEVFGPASVRDLSTPSVLRPGLTTRRVEHRGQTFLIAEVDLDRVTLHLVGQGEHWTPPVSFSDVAAHIDPDPLLWATNAGMYHTGGRPVGLHVEQGRVQRPLHRGTGPGNFFLAPNGALLIDPSGARIRTTAEIEDLAGVSLATQSGPLLCRDGALHPALRADSPNRLRRSAVGVVNPKRVVFAISDSGVRFHELATLLCGGLKAADALYLDGVVSAWTEDGATPYGDGGWSGVIGVW